LSCVYFNRCVFSGCPAERYSGVFIQESSHPAVQAAAELMAKKLGLPKGAVQSAAAVSAPAGRADCFRSSNESTD
jgi:hypothetical protein